MFVSIVVCVCGFFFFLFKVHPRSMERVTGGKSITGWLEEVLLESGYMLFWKRKINIQRAILGIWINIYVCFLSIQHCIDQYTNKKQCIFPSLCLSLSIYFSFFSLLFSHLLIWYNTCDLETLLSNAIDFIVIDLRNMTEWYLYL